MAEFGFNHNGDIRQCRLLVAGAAAAGCAQVKLQKRTPTHCVPVHQRGYERHRVGANARPRNKEKIELCTDDVRELLAFARGLGMELIRGIWGKQSSIDAVNAVAPFTRIGKIGRPCSAFSILCAYARQNFEALMVSTGMSTEQEIKDCFAASRPDELFCTRLRAFPPLQHSSVSATWSVER